ncbi:hypothetical protein os4_34690 [Comamonadaceae bacterium OS-4]|nr:hypothetical protein os4_34690 [Comamonadaceae bacterium OS-4]
MRYIPLHTSGGPKKNGAIDQAWLDAAAALTTALEKAPDKDARDAIIADPNNEIWGDIKPWLMSLSHSKCWFSEAIDVFSHKDVEHFRPKMECKRSVGQRKATYEDGYWWLSYDWANYRFFGNVGNRKKGSLFPLMPNSLVATFGGLSINNEIPVFLDPTCDSDPELLDFNSFGKAIPHPDATDYEQYRVTKTVTHLKLDFDELEEARAKIWTACNERIDRCREIASKAMGPADEAEVKAIKKSLRAMVQPDAPFSMTAAACLRKSDAGWARTLAAGAYTK